MPSWSESSMRIDAATRRRESVSLRARTGAPARARTVLTPTARRSVLFPDMLEPETLRVEERLLPGRRGKDVLGALEAVAREREERVELPHRLEPARNLWARGAPPGLDRERELRSPEKEGGYGS